MIRRHLTFPCEGAMLAGTVDDATAATGLLIVSGGNEIRAGAWSGQALLAQSLAAQGYPVFRFDRRGTGDSEGANGGFLSSAPDIAAALAAFRSACPHLQRVIAFGNCDAASALMLACGAGLDGLVLANPWTFERADAPPPASVVRDHYRRRLADRGAIMRLLKGDVPLGNLLRSLRDAVRPTPAPAADTLATRMAAGIAGYAGPVRLLLAGRDRTADAFRAGWPAKDPRVHICPDATHGFVEPHAREWLTAQILAVLKQS